MPYTVEQVEHLIDGTLDWETVHWMLSEPKDIEGFGIYRQILQERVSWDDPILLPLGPHLYIVVNKSNNWVVKCECGHECCDYQENWKLEALIYVRDTKDRLSELYPTLMAPDPEWQVIREYYCPQCGTQLEVENPTA
jgi:acetone carboxylase, gamma subunit